MVPWFELTWNTVCKLVDLVRDTEHVADLRQEWITDFKEDLDNAVYSHCSSIPRESQENRSESR